MIANAVVHRSYLNYGSIQIFLFDNRLEVTMPGTLLSGVTIDKMKEGFSQVRNKAIAAAFLYMRIIERMGSGIPRIFRECREYGLPEPQLVDFDGDFRMNMFRTIQAPIQAMGLILSDKDRSFLDEIRHNPKVTHNELAKNLGLPLGQVKYYMDKLKKWNASKRGGNPQIGHWEIQ